ncbi:DUF3096 domain-containing protein [Candidatus Woesearchaeota archaeon]|nr:DUF3096 domain-containing protein [Candidatus Woesearchaeota archaeon]
MAFVSVEVTSLLGSLLAIVAGVLVLVFPTLLRVLVGLYLLFVGLLGLLAYL